MAGNRTNPEFVFRILAVEDEKSWQEDMKSAFSAGGIFSRLRFAEAAVDAEKALAERHIHFLSVDQNLPERIGEAVAEQVGMGLLRRAADAYPSTMQVVYTGYPEISPAHDAGVYQVSYFSKSATGEDDEARRIYSADGWAKKIRAMLTEGYVPFLLKQGERLLPPGLAERSALLAKYVGGSCTDDLAIGGTEREYCAFLTDLWENTLCLNWGLALALAQRAKMSLDAADGSSWAGMESGLEKLLPQLARRGWLSPWRSYVGSGSPTDGKSAGRYFLEGASKPLRQMRNEMAHSLTAEYVDVSGIREPTLILLDAVAFWMDHPMRARCAILDPKGIYRCEELRADWPWKESEGTLGAHIRGPLDPEHLYLVWREPQGRPFFLDLWPFICLDNDPSVGHRVLYVTSHFRSGRWQRRGLRDGTLTPWDDAERRSADAALRSVLPISSSRSSDRNLH